MSRASVSNRISVLLAAGIVAGAAVAGADNFLFGGEVSPIVIVAMLLAVAVAAGWIWDWRGGIPAVLVWVCLPLAHLVKHVMGLPDTLQPNTLASILMLAAFTSVVALLGTGVGVLLRRATTTAVKNNS